MTRAPFPHVSKLKNLSWNLYSVTIRLICGRCVVWHHIVGTTIFFFDRFRSAYLASPEWTQSFLNVPLLVHRHRITMLIFKEPGTMVWLRLILPSNMTGTVTFLRVQGSDENSVALVCSLWATFRPYPPSQRAAAN